MENPATIDLLGCCTFCALNQILLLPGACTVRKRLHNALGNCRMYTFWGSTLVPRLIWGLSIIAVRAEVGESPLSSNHRIDAFQ